MSGAHTATSQAHKEQKIALARSVLAKAEAAHGTTAHTLGTVTLPVASQLSFLLPHQGIKSGSVMGYEGATSLLLALLSRPSQEGAWCAVVGFPHLNALAAAEAGVDLQKLALIPHTGSESSRIVATLVDGFDLVVVGKEVCENHLNTHVKRQINARVKERGATLFALGSWPETDVVMNSRVASWHGVGRGYGRLTKQDLIVGRGGRGAAQRSLTARLTLPLTDKQ